MDVKFIETTSAKLDNLAIVNGQIIALSDTNAMYYDLNNTRYIVGSAVDKGNSNTFGIVRVSDSYTSSAGTAVSSVAASSYALNQVYNLASIKQDASTAITTSNIGNQSVKSAENITGVVAIANGGTGGNSIEAATRNLFNSSIASPGYIFTLPASGWTGGYSSISQLKSAMLLNNVNNTSDSNKSVKYATSAGSVDTINNLVTLLANVYSTTSKTVTITDISNFSWLLVNFSTAANITSNIISSVIISVYDFKTYSPGPYYELPYVNSTGALTKMTISVDYVSNTKIKITMSDVYRGVVIYGIK